MIHDLIDAAGVKLADNMRTGYTDGYEFVLADEAIAAFTDGCSPEVAAGYIDAALEQLVIDYMLDPVMVDCLLDDEDEASYDATRKMAEILIAEIQRQGNQRDALRRLVTKEIVASADVDMRIAQAAK